MKSTSIDADSNIVKDFPRLAEEDIRELTIGVYQLKTAKSYAAEPSQMMEWLKFWWAMTFPISFVLKFKAATYQPKSTHCGLNTVKLSCPGTVLVRMGHDSLEWVGTYPALFGTWLLPDIIIMQEMSLLAFGIGQRMWTMQFEPLTAPKMKTPWIIRDRKSS